MNIAVPSAVLPIALLVLAPLAGAQQLSAKLAPQRPVSGGLYGAALDLDGERLIVGAAEAGAPWSLGLAFVYERTAGSWGPPARLASPDPEPYDQFGFSVSISGERAVVGDPGDNEQGSDSGSVHVYERRPAGPAGPAGWVHSAKLTAGDGLAGDRFGEAVSISGSRLVVGAQQASDAGQASGAAYVFELTGAGWTQVARLTAPDAEAFERFGVAVDLHLDTLIIGSEGDSELAPAGGSAYMFERDSRGWQSAGKLSAPNAAALHGFGASVSVSGSTAIVGTRTGGYAYVFERGTQGWTLGQQLGFGADYFGHSVAISGDRLVVASDSAAGTTPTEGVSHVYERTPAGWAVAAVLHTDGTPYSSSSCQVAVSRCNLALGSPLETTSAPLGGAVYVFEGCSN